MKILILSNSIGGFVNFRIELLERLVERGDEVYISSQIEKNASPEPIISKGGTFLEMEMNQRGTNPIQEMKLIRAYGRQIEQVKPDIVLAYTIKPNIYGSVAARRHKVPVICSVTGLGSAIENGGLLQKISVMLYRWGMKRTDYLFFQNQYSLDFFDAHHIRPKARGLIHGSGVNLRKFEFKPYPSDADGIKFLLISRLLPAKGIREYLQVAERIKAKYPDVSFHIIGIRDDEELSDLVEQKSTEGVVVYHGQKDDVRPYIQDCHCLVHPSYYSEGMSNVLQESASMGRPAITTDKAGCKDVIEEGVTGFAVAQKDVEALYQAVERFILIPHGQKEEMGLKARERMEREFDRDIIIQTYIDKIDELVASRQDK